MWVQKGTTFAFGAIVLLQRFLLLLFQVALTLLVILINSYKKIEQFNFQLFPIIFIAVVACKIEWHCNSRVIQQKFRDEDIPMEWNKDNAMATLDVAKY